MNHTEQTGQSNIDTDSQNEESTIENTKSSSLWSNESDLSEWMDLLDNKEILKKILYSIERSPEEAELVRVNRGSKVRINLETKVYSTQQVIPSECFQNIEVVVGEYDVIHGVDLILPMMYLNEISRILISPRFAYGSKGKAPDVEPNCYLDCSVEILEIQNDLDSCTLEEKVELAEKRKARGNFWYARDEHQTAVSCYRKCVEIAYEQFTDSDLNDRVHRLLVDCYNNLSLTQMKIDSLNAALESVDNALSYEPKNVKAIYRKAQILEKKNCLEEAVELLKFAIELEPSNQSIANLLASLRKRRLIQLEAEKRMYQKMINPESKSTNDDNSPDTFDSPNISDSRFTDTKQCNSVSKRFNYILIGVSTMVALVLAYLINNYLMVYA